MTRRMIAVLGFILAVSGCGTNSKQPFFKPEMSGAVYASNSSVDQSSDPTADDSARHPSLVTKVPLNSVCYYAGTEYGWTCSGDVWEGDGLLTLSDNAGDYNTLKLHTINAP